MLAHADFHDQFRTDDYLPKLPDVRENAYLLAPSQQTLAAFTHWAEVPCNELHPLFGTSYDPIERRPSPEAPGILTQKKIIAALAQNEIPDYRKTQRRASGMMAYL